MIQPTLIHDSLPVLSVYTWNSPPTSAGLTVVNRTRRKSPQKKEPRKACKLIEHGVVRMMRVSSVVMKSIVAKDSEGWWCFIKLCHSFSENGLGNMTGSWSCSWTGRLSTSPSTVQSDWAAQWLAFQSVGWQVCPQCFTMSWCSKDWQPASADNSFARLPVGWCFFFFVLADPQFRHKFFTLWGSGHSPGRLGLEVLNSFAFWVGACPCKLFSVGGTGMY